MNAKQITFSCYGCSLSGARLWVLTFLTRISCPCCGRANEFQEVK